MKPLVRVIKGRVVSELVTVSLPRLQVTGTTADVEERGGVAPRSPGEAQTGSDTDQRLWTLAFVCVTSERIQILLLP